MSNATSPAAAALSASARVRVAARCLGCARAQHDSGRRYLCFRLVRRRQRFQLLVRWVNRGGRDRRCPNSSCTPRDAKQGGSRDVGRQHCTRRVCMAFARRCCWSAVLDRVDSAPRSFSSATNCCASWHSLRCSGSLSVRSQPVISGRRSAWATTLCLTRN